MRLVILPGPRLAGAATITRLVMLQNENLIFLEKGHTVTAINNL
jgi:hypothetical protein